MPPAVGSIHLTSDKYDVASQWHSNFKVEASAKFKGQRKKAKDTQIAVIKASVSWGNLANVKVFLLVCCYPGALTPVHLAEVPIADSY